MARIGFIGLGNMGLPMALNLLKAGHAVTGFDVVAAAGAKLAAAGGTAVTSLAAVASGAEVVITMLPAGKEVREVYLGADGVGMAIGDCTGELRPPSRRLGQIAVGADRRLQDHKRPMLANNREEGLVERGRGGIRGQSPRSDTNSELEPCSSGHAGILRVA